jgi:uncharacterized protein (UPF0332 family)
VTEEGRRESAAEELELAREELGAARDFVASGKRRLAVPRAYYAMFHAMRAALHAVNVEPATHAGTLHLFNVHYVKTGKFEADTSRHASQLQRQRELADDGEKYVIAQDDLEAIVARVAALVEQVAATLA